MTSLLIDIPHPVFMIEEDYSFKFGPARQPGDIVFKHVITVGGVELFVAEHHNDWELRDADRDKYAENMDDARDKTLTAFGEKLKEVLK